MLDRKTCRKGNRWTILSSALILYLLYDHVQKGFTTTPHSRYEVDTLSLHSRLLSLSNLSVSQSSCFCIAILLVVIPSSACFVSLNVI